MSVEQDAALRASIPLSPSRLLSTAPIRSERLTPPPGLLDSLIGVGPRFVAAAPGRINVIGGLSDYTGALVLHVPTSACVTIGVRLRDDAMVFLAYSRENSEPTTSDFPLQQIYPGNSNWIDSKNAGSFLNGSLPPAFRCVVGTIVEAVRVGALPPFSNGLSIVLQSQLMPDDGELGATAAAAIVALGGLLGATLEPALCIEACRRAINEWMKMPIGPADILNALQALPGGIAEVRCDTCECARSTPLADGLQILGVRYAGADPRSAQKFANVRVASEIGRLLIERIVSHEHMPGLEGNLHLARVAVNDYVDRFRDRLPTKLKGSDFLSRFKDSTGHLSTVQPATIYKVRSRTEHHIYENVRAQEFIQILGRSMRTGQKSALTKIDELMTASHWSYGQRCGLGNPSADLLVKMIKKQGSAGIHGAKITGTGGGGSLCVVLEQSEKARTGLQGALDSFASKTGHAVTVIESGNTPGALLCGARSF